MRMPHYTDAGPGRKIAIYHEMLLERTEMVDRRGQNHESLAPGTCFNHDKTHWRSNTMKKTILLTACLALTLGGCASTDSKPAASAKPAAATASPELDQTIASAEKEIAAAKKANNIWRDTEKFLDQAKEAKAAGKADDAMKLAKKALKQAQLAQQQAASQASTKPYYPN
jgi:hypothetical protein